MACWHNALSTFIHPFSLTALSWSAVGVGSIGQHFCKTKIRVSVAGGKKNSSVVISNVCLLGKHFQERSNCLI